MAKKGNAGSKGMKIKILPLILVVLAAVFTYVAQYLKFPNTWGIVFGLIFIVLIIKNFNKKKGVDILVYFLMWNILTVPLFISLMSLDYKTIYIVGNILAYSLMITGLMTGKKWGLWLSVILFILSILTISSSLTQIGILNLGLILVLGRNLLMLVFMIISVVYLIKARKYF